jgi:hypothetical protein
MKNRNEDSVEFTITQVFTHILLKKNELYDVNFTHT